MKAIMNLRFNILFFLYMTIFAGKIKEIWKRIPSSHRKPYKNVKKAVACSYVVAIYE